MWECYFEAKLNQLDKFRIILLCTISGLLGTALGMILMMLRLG